MPSADSGLGVTARCGITYIFHNIALSLVLLGYVTLGGLLFYKLEAGYEVKQKASVRNFRDDCLRELWLITERLNVLYERNWTQLVDMQLRKLERSIIEETSRKSYELSDWTFNEALLYSLTVVTTVGNGDVAPRTAEGKVVTMFYALLGVPLMLLCLSNLGTMFAYTFQTAYCRLCCKQPLPRKHGLDNSGKNPRSTLVTIKADCSRAVCSLTPDARQLLEEDLRQRDSDQALKGYQSVLLRTPSRVPLIWRVPEESGRAATPPLWHSQSRVPPPVVLMVLGVYLTLGSAAFAAWQGWNLLDAFYFCFVTLSTISFGDVVPGRSMGQLQTMACCAYLFLGLVLIAMSFSLLQEEVVSRGRHLANAVGLVQREDLAL